jgi:hypothetical protein
VDGAWVVDEEKVACCATYSAEVRVFKSLREPGFGGRRNGLHGENNAGDGAGICVNRPYEQWRRCLVRRRTSGPSFSRALILVVSCKYIASPVPSPSSCSLRLAYRLGLSNGRLSSFLPLPIHLPGGNVTHLPNPAHTNPNTIIRPMIASRPNRKYQITLEPGNAGCCMLGWCRCTECGTMASGYRKDGGEGRG